MKHNLKIVDDTIRDANKQIENLYQHTNPSVKFYFSVVGADSDFSDEYIISICYRTPNSYGIPTETLATLDPKEYSFENFVEIMKELFAKWKIPIEAMSLTKDQYLALKNTFNDALHLEED